MNSLAISTILACLIVEPALAGGAGKVPPLLPAPVCHHYVKVAATLAGQFLVGRGFISSRLIVQIYASPEGAWTVLLVQPSGCSRTVGKGEGFEAFAIGAPA